MKQNNLVSVPIENYLVLWLGDLNKYIIVTPLVAEVVSFIYEIDDERLLLKEMMEKQDLTESEAEILLLEVRNKLESIAEPNVLAINAGGESQIDLSQINFPLRHYYRFHDKLISIEFASEYLEYLIHPKIMHLEDASHENVVSQIQLVSSNNQLLLHVDGSLKWSLKSEEELFLVGKVSMEILNALYAKDEKEWLAVFHAAGISNGKECLVFSGACGAGKSSLSAILMAKGYHVLADDFLPMSDGDLEMYSFPAAISLKGDSIAMLDKDFPELNKLPQRSICRSGKSMRYVYAHSMAAAVNQHVPCTALVLLEYVEGAGCTIKEVSKIDAIQALIPDTWISGRADSAEKFLAWIKEMSFYSIQYDDNEAIIDLVEKLFRHEI